MVTAVENEDGGRRAAQDEVLVEALAAGLSYARAAEMAGVVSRTVSRRMQDPGFAARVSRRRAEWVSEVTGQLVAASAEAVRTIRDLCRDAERPADRLRSASLLLQMAQRFRHESELDERIHEVEVRLGIAETTAPDVEGVV